MEGDIVFAHAENSHTFPHTYTHSEMSADVIDRRSVALISARRWGGGPVAAASLPLRHPHIYPPPCRWATTSWRHTSFFANRRVYVPFFHKMDTAAPPYQADQMGLPCAVNREPLQTSLKLSRETRGYYVLRNRLLHTDIPKKVAFETPKFPILNKYGSRKKVEEKKKRNQRMNFPPLFLTSPFPFPV